MGKTSQEDSYTHILKYTGLFGGVQGLNILVALVRNKLVAMILGPDGMGLVSLFNSTIKLVSDSTNLGISMSAVKNLSADYEAGDDARLRKDLSVVRSWSLATAIVGMLLCIVLSPLLNRFTFTWGDHVVHFILLSPVVGMASVTGGELAVLKATRRLSSLAVISVINVVLALVLTTPLYFVWGQAAIVPSLIVMALVQMWLTVRCSWRFYPPCYGVCLRNFLSVLSSGMPMIRLGVAFVFAGMLGSGADFLIRTYLNTHGSLGEVGLFNAGYMITMTYAGMVFTAMETDYFPRLSACCSDNQQMCIVVNRQIEVSLLIISPMLVLFSTALPVIIPLLFSNAFIPVTDMAQIMILAMYMRAIKLPIAYMPLAKGDSKSYLLMEGMSALMIVVGVVVCYDDFGLTGTGIAVAVVSVLDFIMLWGYMHFRYGFSISRPVWLYMAVQMSIGVAAYSVTLWLSGVVYWFIGLFLVLLSGWASVEVLRRKTGLWMSLKEKIGRRS